MDETDNQDSKFFWTRQTFKPEELTPDKIIAMYEDGYFPMAGDADDPDIGVMYCEPRAIFPLDAPKFSKSLRKKVLKGAFDVSVNTCFPAVIEACSQRRETWINPAIKTLFNDLHKMGHAHSVEVWKDDRLVGGLYGVQINAAFCGESMFSTESDASKVALVHLHARLWKNGFTLLDAQATTKHLKSLGVVPVPQSEYLSRLSDAHHKKVSFENADLDEKTMVQEYLHAHP